MVAKLQTHAQRLCLRILLFFCVVQRTSAQDPLTSLGSALVHEADKPPAEQYLGLGCPAALISHVESSGESSNLLKLFWMDEVTNPEGCYSALINSGMSPTELSQQLSSLPGLYLGNNLSLSSETSSCLATLSKQQGGAIVADYAYTMHRLAMGDRALIEEQIALEQLKRPEQRDWFPTRHGGHFEGNKDFERQAMGCLMGTNDARTDTVQLLMFAFQFKANVEMELKRLLAEHGVVSLGANGPVLDCSLMRGEAARRNNPKKAWACEKKEEFEKNIALVETMNPLLKSDSFEKAYEHFSKQWINLYNLPSAKFGDEREKMFSELSGALEDILDVELRNRSEELKKQSIVFKKAGECINTSYPEENCVKKYLRKALDASPEIEFSKLLEKSFSESSDKTASMLGAGFLSDASCRQKLRDLRTDAKKNIKSTVQDVVITAALTAATAGAYGIAAGARATALAAAEGAQATKAASVAGRLGRAGGFVDKYVVSARFVALSADYINFSHSGIRAIEECDESLAVQMSDAPGVEFNPEIPACKDPSKVVAARQKVGYQQCVLSALSTSLALVPFVPAALKRFQERTEAAKQKMVHAAEELTSAVNKDPDLPKNLLSRSEEMAKKATSFANSKLESLSPNVRAGVDRVGHFTAVTAKEGTKVLVAPVLADTAAFFRTIHDDFSRQFLGRYTKHLADATIDYTPYLVGHVVLLHSIGQRPELFYVRHENFKDEASQLVLNKQPKKTVVFTSFREDDILFNRTKSEVALQQAMAEARGEVFEHYLVSDPSELIAAIRKLSQEGRRFDRIEFNAHGEVGSLVLADGSGLDYSNVMVDLASFPLGNPEADVVVNACLVGGKECWDAPTDLGTLTLVNDGKLFMSFLGQALLPDGGRVVASPKVVTSGGIESWPKLIERAGALGPGRQSGVPTYLVADDLLNNRPWQTQRQMNDDSKERLKEAAVYVDIFPRAEEQKAK